MAKKKSSFRAKRSQGAQQQQNSRSGPLRLYGAHATRAALENPQRTCLRLIASEEALEREQAWLSDVLKEHRPSLPVSRSDRQDLDSLLPPGAVHQGLVLEAQALPDRDIRQIARDAPAGRQVIVVLDQVTDPHNAGAILRSAAAFGALAVLNTERKAAQESGTLAKSASGALDLIPYLQVTNLARTLELLKKEDFWVLGLAGEVDQTLGRGDLPEKLVLCLGAEGSGLRRLTRELCDFLVKLPTKGPLRDLNVSNAAAVALYDLLGSEA